MSKRKGPNKLQVANARTYPRADDAMKAEKCPCLGHRPPPQHVLDAIAEREILGGYRPVINEAKDGTRTIDAASKCRCGLLLNMLGQCPLCQEY